MQRTCIYCYSRLVASAKRTRRVSIFPGDLSVVVRVSAFRHDQIRECRPVDLKISPPSEPTFLISSPISSGTSSNRFRADEDQEIDYWRPKRPDRQPIKCCGRFGGFRINMAQPVLRNWIWHRRDIIIRRINRRRHQPLLANKRSRTRSNVAFGSVEKSPLPATRRRFVDLVLMAPYRSVPAALHSSKMRYQRSRSAARSSRCCERRRIARSQGGFSVCARRKRERLLSQAFEMHDAGPIREQVVIESQQAIRGTSQHAVLNQFARGIFSATHRVGRQLRAKLVCHFVGELSRDAFFSGNLLPAANLVFPPPIDQISFSGQLSVFSKLAGQ